MTLESLWNTRKLSGEPYSWLAIIYLTKEFCKSLNPRYIHCANLLHCRFLRVCGYYEDG